MSSLKVLRLVLLRGVDRGRRGDANAGRRARHASGGATASVEPGAARTDCCARSALDPDDLLSQAPTASTYPLEVVQAARWTSQTPKMTGKVLEDAMAKQTWDPSVKGLVAVPQTLAMMSEKLDWLQQLGDAFLDDQGAVLDAVQRLRKRAEGTGNLKTSPQMKVSNVSRPGPTGQPAEYIVVEPADRKLSTCRSTIRASFTVHGLIPTIRRTTTSRLAAFRNIRLRRPCLWGQRRGRCGDLGRRELVEPKRQRQRQPLQLLQPDQHRRRQLELQCEPPRQCALPQ